MADKLLLVADVETLMSLLYYDATVCSRCDCSVRIFVGGRLAQVWTEKCYFNLYRKEEGEKSTSEQWKNTKKKIAIACEYFGLHLQAA